MSVVNNLPDNPVGQTDIENPAGNHVVLDLGNREFAFSRILSAGDVVDVGSKRGLCGNSGNTSEPHLHLETNPYPDAGEGLPAQFEEYLAASRPVVRGETVKDETIWSALQGLL